MKTSLDLPDDLYREVKEKSTREGRTARDVAIALFAAWLDDRVSADDLIAATPAAHRTDPWPAWRAQWRVQWRELTKQISRSDAAAGGLVDQLHADRR